MTQQRHTNREQTSCGGGPAARRARAAHPDSATATSPVHRRTTTEALLADAALFHLLGAAFAYPTAAQVGDVTARFARVRAARPRCPRTALTTAADAWRAADGAALPGEYLRLFHGSGPCPLHEAAYGDGRRIAGRPVELADVQGFYHAFGFEQSDRNPDLPDHLCAELEFYSLLLLKQAYARDAGWTRRYDIARRAATAFLADHLGRWVPALAEQLAEHAAAEPYRSLAALLAAAVAAQCRRLRVAPQLAPGLLPHDFMQDDELVCPHG